MEIPKKELTDLSVVLRNGLEGEFIYNHTYTIAKRGYMDWEMMGCNRAETCKKICDEMQGIMDEQTRLCIFTQYLNELCYRVNNENDHYRIDEPPVWDLSYHTGLPGCE